MTRALPALVAALAVGLLPLPAFAEQGNRARERGEFCPPGLARRDPPCIPPGQVGRQARRDRDHQDRALELLNEFVRDRDENRARDEERERAEDNDAEEALAIVGALMGLALLERAARDDGPEDVAPAPAPEPVAPWSPPEIPARPDRLALVEEPAAPSEEFVAPRDETLPPSEEADPPAVISEPPSAPAEAAPAIRIPPPPPSAPSGAPTSDEISDVFERAQTSGATGF